MGHITNAKIFRVGHNTHWLNRLFSPRLPVYSVESNFYFAVDSYFSSLFSYLPHFSKQGLLFSHLAISKDNVGCKVVEVFYYDSLLELFFVRSICKRFFRSSGSKKNVRYPNKNFRRKDYVKSLTNRNLSSFRFVIAQRYNNFFQRVISRRFYGDFRHRRVKLLFKRINAGSVTPRITGLFILSRLRRVSPLKSILSRVVRYFRDSNRFLGVTLKVSGRFSRAEMASTRVETFGKVSLSTKSQLIDYGFTFLPLKYGVTGVKIWFNYNNSIRFKE